MTKGMQRLVISTEHPFLSSRLSEANGEIWLFDPDTCRFLDCALRAPLEMTGGHGVIADFSTALEMTKNPLPYRKGEGKVKKPLAGNFIFRHGLRAASSVSSALKSLVENEIVYKSPEGYMVYDRFMAEWLRR